MCDRCARLEAELADAIKTRTLAQEASSRDLLAKRDAELERDHWKKVATTPTLMHGVPFEYDPTPLGNDEHHVIVRQAAVPKVNG